MGTRVPLQVSATGDEMNRNIGFQEKSVVRNDAIPTWNNTSLRQICSHISVASHQRPDEFARFFLLTDLFSSGL